MNLQPIIDERNKLADDLRRMDAALELLGWTPDGEPVVRPMKARRTKPSPPAPLPSAGRGEKAKGAPGTLAARRALVVAAIGKCGETFTAEEVVFKGGLTKGVKSLSANFRNWTAQGWLACAGEPKRGVTTTYRRGLKWKAFAAPQERQEAAGDGKLTRLGSGSSAFYRANGKPADSDENIHVPRDADAGKDDE